MAHSRGPLVVRTAVVTACLLLAVACGAAQEAGDADAPDEVAVAATLPADVDDRAPTDDVVEVEDDDRPVERSLRPTIDAAIRDLAVRAAVDPDQVTIVLAQRVTWPDETLGCPLRGSERIGGPRQGIRVHLEANERVYRYHTGGARDEPFLCDPRAAKSEDLGDRIEP